MELRVRLGQYLYDTNLVTDGVFNTGCGAGNWVCAGGWGIAAGVASMVAGYGFVEQDGVYTSDGISPNTLKYQTQFVTGGYGGIDPYVKLFVGDYSIETLIADAGGTHTFDHKHLDGANDDIRFLGNATVQLDNVSVYNYKWNDPLEDQPSFEGTKLKLGNGKIMDDLICTWVGDLIFDGDGYDYIKDIYDGLTSEEFCSRMDILIERNNDGTWERHFEGYIYLADCEFNFKERTVTIKKIMGLVEDYIERIQDTVVQVSPYGEYFYNNGISVNYPARDLWYPTCVPPGGGWGNNGSAFEMDETILYMAHMASNMEVTLNDVVSWAVWDEYSIATDDMLRTAFVLVTNTDPYIINESFSNIYTGLNCVFNLGRYEDFSNLIPSLYIRDRVFPAVPITQTFTYENVNSEIIKYNDLNRYANVEIGYTSSDERSDWDVWNYKSDDNCNENTLGLVSPYIGDVWTFDDAICTPTDYDNLFQCTAWFNPGSGNLEARDGLGAGLNDQYRSSDMMVAHVFTLPSGYTDSRGDGPNAAPKGNDAYIKEVEFETPVSLAELDAIRTNPDYQINYTAPEYEQTAESGYILDFEFDNTEMTGKFKLII